MILRRPAREHTAALIALFLFASVGAPGILGVHTCLNPGHSEGANVGEAPTKAGATTDPHAGHHGASGSVDGTDLTSQDSSSPDAEEFDCGCGCRVVCLTASATVGIQSPTARVVVLPAPQTVTTERPSGDPGPTPETLRRYFLPPAIAPPAA